MVLEKTENQNSRLSKINHQLFYISAKIPSMKRLALFLSLAPLLLFAQRDTTTYYSDGLLKEKYLLNKEGNKDGPYTCYSRFGKKYISGQYANGEPAGTWEFFSSDTNAFLVQKLDFTTHKELFVDSLRQPSLICGPRYFGGNFLRQEYIQNRIKTDFTEAEKELLKGQNYTVIFLVDQKTLRPVGASCADTELSETIRKKMEKIVAEMPAWLPPVCGKDKDTVWRFSVAFVF